MRPVRIALEISAVLAALTATLTALLLTLGVGLVPRTVSKGEEIERAFLKAAEFIDRSIQSNGRVPTQPEFQEWRADKGRWVSRMELTKSSDSNADVQMRFRELPENAYVLSVWRGEWSEHYAQGKGSTVDSAIGLYSSSIGIAMGACGLSAVLWSLARRLKRSNSCAA